MIQIESVEIRELRGIRTLEILPTRKSYAVSGPNGSGKSGVVDAIQFGLTGDISRLEALKTSRNDAMAKYGGENWVVNKAVHYTEWADFSKAEFKSVVDAFKTLLLQFRCAKCDSWLYITPRKGDPEALRCGCMTVCE